MAGAAAGEEDQSVRDPQSVLTMEVDEGRLTPVYAEVPPQVDGVLDDLCWRDAARRPTATASGFVYRGLPFQLWAEEQTTVYAAYDEEYLYFGARCEVANPDDVVGRILIRDANLWYDDSFEVFVDTFHDRKSAYYFGVNPLNTQMDGHFSEEGEVENRNWDGIWYSATKINHDSWTVEMKIPFRTLRFGLFNDEWGVNFARFHKHSSDQTIWKDTGENLLRVSLYGTMDVPEGIRKRPVVDVLPYVSGSYRDLAKYEDEKYDHKEGLDVAARFLPSMTVLGTYRPDFAQVEADPYQINLTDEELFYPEKRPLFLDGQEYFDTPIRTFYSRRIGDIEYGGKFIGRAGPTHLYALSVEADEYLEDPENPEGPHRYNYTVARVKQDITKYASVGLLGLRRTGDTWRHNDAVSADANISFNDELIFSGQFLRVLDDETGLSENGFDVGLTRYTSGLSLGAGYTDLDSRLDILKTGYIPYDDVKGYWAWADYDLWLYRLGIKKLNWNVEHEHYLNHGEEIYTPFGSDDQRLQREGVSGEMGVYFENKLTVRALVESNFRAEVVKGLYEPPPVEPPYGERVRFNYENRYYAGTVGYNLEEWSSVYAFYEWGSHFDYDLDYWGGGFSVNPFSRLTLAYDLDYETLDGSFYDEGTGETDHYYYEFIINRLHADLNITDDVAARLFVQSSSDLGHYATNALLSYEFMKGSHIYLVYNEKRLYRDHLRDELGRGLLDQIIFLKVNYLLGL
ncbi:MAG: DUF5916 domain-containing protein [Candidatus Zixiibacteriota bacterium]